MQARAATAAGASYRPRRPEPVPGEALGQLVERVHAVVGQDAARRRVDDAEARELAHAAGLHQVEMRDDEADVRGRHGIAVARDLGAVPADGRLRRVELDEGQAQAFPLPPERVARGDDGLRRARRRVSGREEDAHGVAGVVGRVELDEVAGPVLEPPGQQRRQRVLGLGPRHEAHVPPFQGRRPPLVVRRRPLDDDLVVVAVRGEHRRAVLVRPVATQHPVAGLDPPVHREAKINAPTLRAVFDTSLKEDILQLRQLQQ